MSVCVHSQCTVIHLSCHSLPWAVIFRLTLSMMSPFQGAHSTPHSWVMAKALMYWLTVGEEEVWWQRTICKYVLKINIVFWLNHLEESLPLNLHKCFSTDSYLSLLTQSWRFSWLKKIIKSMNSPDRYQYRGSSVYDVLVTVLFGSVTVAMIFNCAFPQCSLVSLTLKTSVQRWL